MSDERLREAARRWRETGAVEDEAIYLLQRVRAGGLRRDQLELAACCGHEGARAATLVRPLVSRRAIPNDEVLDELERCSQPLALVFALAAVRRSEAHRFALPADIDPRHFQALADAIHAWALAPGEECRLAVERLITRAGLPSYVECFGYGQAWPFALDAVESAARMSFGASSLSAVFSFAASPVEVGEGLSEAQAAEEVRDRCLDACWTWCLAPAEG